MEAELILLNEGELTLRDGTARKSAALSKRITVIGWDHERVDIRLTGRLISNIHCTILYDEELSMYYLIDKQSTNGTRINDEQVQAGELVPLKNGDYIELGTAGKGGAILGFYTAMEMQKRTTIVEASLVRNRTLFISYSRKDSDLMRRVRDELSSATPLKGLNVWTDERLNVGTEAWQKEIERTIEKSLAVVVLLSPDSKRSEWVEKELNYARTHKVRIFPMLVRGDETDAIPLSLIDLQWTDIRTDYRSGVNRLIADLYQYWRQMIS